MRAVRRSRAALDIGKAFCSQIRRAGRTSVCFVALRRCGGRAWGASTAAASQALCWPAILASWALRRSRSSFTAMCSVRERRVVDEPFRRVLGPANRRKSLRRASSLVTFAHVAVMVAVTIVGHRSPRSSGQPKHQVNSMIRHMTVPRPP